LKYDLNIAKKKQQRIGSKYIEKYVKKRKNILKKSTITINNTIEIQTIICKIRKNMETYDKNMIEI